MDKERLIEFIRANIPNVGVSHEALRAIADHFELRQYTRNDYFLKEGKICGYLFLAEGFMRAYTYDTEGNEVTTYFYGQDRVVFEATSFFHQLPSSENIQAVTDCVGFYTSFEKLNQLFHGVPEFREFGRQMLVKEFAAYKRRALAMINKTAEQRYLELLQDHREIFQFAQLRHIASYLGITDSSLSRIRRESAKK